MKNKTEIPAEQTTEKTSPPPKQKPREQPPAPAKEIGGRGGFDPVRYGDWEVGGKCVDF
jgi:hypothetical protein